jgi:hypothetical protein
MFDQRYPGRQPASLFVLANTRAGPGAGETPASLGSRYSPQQRKGLITGLQVLAEEMTRDPA